MTLPPGLGFGQADNTPAPPLTLTLTLALTLTLTLTLTLQGWVSGKRIIPTAPAPVSDDAAQPGTSAGLTVGGYEYSAHQVAEQTANLDRIIESMDVTVRVNPKP